MAFTPTDPTKAEVRVTGTGPSYGFDFYIPRGAKGEPGGLTSTSVPTNTDLNQYVTPGAYSVSAGTDAAASALANLPFHESGAMLVTLSQTGGIQIQTYTTNTKSIYVRRRFNGTWGAWRVFTSTRVDSTAGRAIYQWDDTANREQLIYGDTGLREISSLVNAAFFDNTAAARQVFIRRTGSVVSVTGQMLSTASTSSVSALTIPNGFRPQSVVESTALNIRGASSWARVNTAGGGANILSLIVGPGAVNGGFQAGDVFNISTTWVTSDPWPTTLPGTAVGSIPNL